MIGNETDRDRDRDRETQRRRDREAESERDTETERQTDKGAYRQRDREPAEIERVLGVISGALGPWPLGSRRVLERAKMRNMIPIDCTLDDCEVWAWLVHWWFGGSASGRNVPLGALGGFARPWLWLKFAYGGVHGGPNGLSFGRNHLWAA